MRQTLMQWAQELNTTGQKEAVATVINTETVGGTITELRADAAAAIACVELIPLIEEHSRNLQDGSTQTATEFLVGKAFPGELREMMRRVLLLPEDDDGVELLRAYNQAVNDLFPDEVWVEGGVDTFTFVAPHY